MNTTIQKSIPMKNSIQFEMEYPHSIEKVWSAISTKEALSQWLMPCTMEPEIGNKFQFTTKPYPGFNGIVHCELLRFEVPNLIEFSWTGGDLKDTVVRFELQSKGDQTLLRFSHSGFEGFLNNLIAKRILARGWKRKLLKVKLLQYLNND